MSKDITAFKDILTANGYKITKARIDTFNLLVSPEPQSISQILVRANGTVDRVSVYRNIELFEKLGIVHRIYIGWKYKIELSDDFISHHHHLSCIKCGVMVDIKDEAHIDDFIKSVAAEANFIPRNHLFEIDGYCQECSDVQAVVT